MLVLALFSNALLAFAPMARPTAPMAITHLRASQPLCVVSTEDKQLLAASKKVTMIAKRFGKDQGKAAQSWVEAAISAGDANSATLMEQQLMLFEECKLDNGGKCKELSDALEALTSAVEKRKKDPDTKSFQINMGATPIQAAATKVRAAATKFGPAQKAAADDWIKRTASGEVVGASTLLEGQVMLFGECVLSEGDSPSNCQQLEQALTDLQIALETCSVAESTVGYPNCSADEVTAALKVENNVWSAVGGSSGYHRMSKGKSLPSKPSNLGWPMVGGSSGAHRMAGRKAPGLETEEAAAPPEATKKQTPRFYGGKRAALKRLLRRVTFREVWPAVGGSSGPHRMTGRKAAAPVAAAVETAEVFAFMGVPAACRFMEANPSVSFAEKKAFLLTKGVGEFVIAEAACTAPDTTLVL